MKKLFPYRFFVSIVTAAIFSCGHSPDTGNKPVEEGAEANLYRSAECGTSIQLINFDTDSGAFDLIRGEEADFPVEFKNCLGLEPFVLTTNAGDYPDFTTCAREIKKSSFTVLLSLSNNSSAPAVNGTFYFDWVVFPALACPTVVDFGQVEFEYVLYRGGSKTAAVRFKTPFGAAPAVFITRNARAKDFVTSASAVTADGFNCEFCLSANASKPKDSGTFRFSWMAVRPDVSIPGFETGWGEIEYDLDRGQSASTNIVFKQTFPVAPIVLLSSLSIARDVYISTCDKTRQSVSVKISLSRNSSEPNSKGTYSIAWLAISKL